MAKGYVIVRRVQEEPVVEAEKAPEVERVSTGVVGLDEALEGGYPMGAWVLVTGEPGTGKTVLTMHAVHAAVKRGYRAVIVSTEMKAWEWLKQAKLLGMDLEQSTKTLRDMVKFDREEQKYIYSDEEPPIVFIDLSSLSYIATSLGVKERAEGKTKRWYSYLDSQTLAEAVDVAFRRFAKNPEDRYYTLKAPTILVVDSLSMFYVRAPALAAKIATDLAIRFKRANTVGLLTAQYAQTTGSTFGFRVEHIADGVVHLWMDNVESAKEVRRYLIIKKMRMTQHSHRAYKVYIEKSKGMRVEPI